MASPSSRPNDVERICQAALEHDTAARAAFLAEACQGNEVLRREVESLLAHATSAGAFMETPALNVAAQRLASVVLPSSMIGRTIGSYTIEAMLGSGGMGQVYRAHDATLGRDVAIKIIAEPWLADPGQRARIEREARLLASLNHPNIVTIYDLGQYEGAPYIVCELLHGQTLREALAGTALPVKRAVEYAIQIAHGLAAAHERGIVHRDLKPENVFLTADGHAKILDFGISKLVEDARAVGGVGAEPTVFATGTGRVLGTVGYMSPEQVRGQNVDYRTDIFNFGVVLHEMLSGSSPFHAETPADSMRLLLNGDVPPLAAPGRGIPPGVEEIVRHCLEPSPAQRFQSAHDLALALQAVAPTRTTTTVHAPALLGVNGQLALAAAVLAAVAGAAWFTGRQTAPTGFPTYEQLTFRRGEITAARFVPGAQTIVYSAKWRGGAEELYEVRPDTRQSRGLGSTDRSLLALARSGELALLERPQRSRGQEGFRLGTLARMPLGSSVPRPLSEDVVAADWAPNNDDLAVVRVAGGKYQLEFPLGTVIYTPRVAISGIRFSPAGDRIAFFEHPLVGDNAGAVTVLDLRTREVRRLTEEYYGTWGLAWVGEEIWFSVTPPTVVPAVYAIAVEGDDPPRMLTRVPGRLRLADVSSDGTALMIRDESYRRVAGLTVDTVVERDLSWFDWTQARGLSADGRLLLFEETGAGVLGRHSVFIRGTNGSEAQRLGDGTALALAPDKATVLARNGNRVVLLSTGPGQPVEVKLPAGLQRVTQAEFTPDSRGAVILAAEAGQPNRLYVGNFTTWRAFTPEGVVGPFALSLDGTAAVARIGGMTHVFQTDGSGQAEVPGLTADDHLAGWASTRELWVQPSGAQVVQLVDIATGRRRPGRLLNMPPGIQPGDLRVTADGRTYVYNYLDAQSTLYRVQGLR